MLQIGARPLSRAMKRFHASGQRGTALAWEKSMRVELAASMSVRAGHGFAHGCRNSGRLLGDVERMHGGAPSNSIWLRTSPIDRDLSFRSAAKIELSHETVTLVGNC